MIRRPAGCLGVNPAEPKLRQIEFLDKDVDYADGVLLADPVFQALGTACSARDRCPQRSASTNGIGADSVLECVGTQESMMQAIRSIRPGGWLHPSTSGSGERARKPFDVTAIHIEWR
jgi:threonine dehydrogenase-like Zn-dependent dehydrogenase